ncbi:MAG TPA: hypothetical protein VG273_13045 [Bryobacteraceae bacterium]|jgi:hypothetical protein|nr:hypothetical protein [Bryobacteraceae bacterium]
MRRGVPLLLCLILLLGGLCNYTCFANVEHQCCHQTPTVSSLQSHPPVSSIQVFPALPAIGFVLYNAPVASSVEVAPSRYNAFSPSLPPLILRL